MLLGEERHRNLLVNFESPVGAAATDVVVVVVFAIPVNPAPIRLLPVATFEVVDDVGTV